MTRGFLELPPRTRRIQPFSHVALFILGTTSAYAENTLQAARYGRVYRNYLRVRGEYSSPSRPTLPTPELPPRPRRILPARIPQTAFLGTISAYAENTFGFAAKVFDELNYLRVRGEYRSATGTSLPSGELPPRTRRILFRPPDTAVFIGTISAYAENTRRGLP